MTSSQRPWVIFDYDDTLGGILYEGKVQGNEVAYWVAIEKFASLMQELGFDRETASTMQQTVDMELCEIHGFSWRPRFAESMVRTYKALATRERKDVRPIILETAYRIGSQVFDYRYLPLEGALFTLNVLRKDYRIAIVTKGEHEEQLRKVETSGVGHFVDRVIVVGHKDEADWKHVIAELQLQDDLSTTWCVGNSIKGDVNGPLRAGMNAIHITRGSWAFEQQEYAAPTDGRRLEIVSDIKEVLNIIPWSK